MSFLRRLRRDKEDPTPAEGAKPEAKEEPADDEVRVWGDNEAPLLQKASPRELDAESPTDSPASRPEASATRPPPDPPAPRAPVEAKASPPPSPAPTPAPTETAALVEAMLAAPPVTRGPPPPLPERGPPTTRSGGGSTASDSACFVCGTPLEGKFCSLCRMTWVE